MTSLFGALRHALRPCRWLMLLAGLMLASLMQFIHISTLNWQSFSELAFSFTLTPHIIVTSMLFAVLMGVIGGFLPAVRAARLSIVDALRAA